MKGNTVNTEHLFSMCFIYLNPKGGKKSKGQFNMIQKSSRAILQYLKHKATIC